MKSFKKVLFRGVVVQISANLKKNKRSTFAQDFRCGDVEVFTTERDSTDFLAEKQKLNHSTIISSKLRNLSIFEHYLGFSSSDGGTYCMR